MDAITLDGHSGWRRTAVINAVLVGSLTITLATITGVVASRGGGISMIFNFYNGSCATANRLNLFLHLLINIVATGIIASSNFFMQILNAPTRAEVDAAHANKKKLELGVQSMKNLLHLSWFKILLTLTFGLSSLPIHLLFNSAVFQTDYLGGSWQMTLAAESFVNGGNYSLPGAYLATSGFWPDYQSSNPDDDYQDWARREGFGLNANITQYQSASGPGAQNITSAAQNAAGWIRLDPYTCRKQYLHCEPRDMYGDVVFVMNTRGENPTPGWTLNEVFPNQTTEDKQFWNDLGLGFRDTDEVNTLWWSLFCTLSRDPKSTDSVCWNECASAIGGYTPYSSIMDNMWPLNSADGNWTILNKEPADLNLTYMESRNTILEQQHRTGFDFDDFSAWEAAYCLAKDASNSCKVGASGLLLLIVTICAAAKTLQCLFVLYRLKGNPLVTPGDAIESFLVNPDPESRSMCTLSGSNFHSHSFGNDIVQSLGPAKSWVKPGPRKWHREAKILANTLTIWNWLHTYLLFLIGLAVSGYFFSVAKEENDNVIQGFSHSYHNGLFDAGWFPWGRFFPSILLANTPQLLLSICYFVYNSLWTRLHSELEWNAFAVRYKPLRVSSPKGEQISTYRLQLPYRYSIPLIFGSILLHWLVSNAIYVLIIEGDYLNDGNFMVKDSIGFATNTYINIGYSSGAILVGVIACSVVASIPLIYAFTWTLKGDIVVAGSNSLAISAACHPTRTMQSSRRTSHELKPHIANESLAECERLIGASLNTKTEGYPNGLNLEERLELSQRKLKWGVLETEERMFEHLPGRHVPVGHLTFGGENDIIEAPKEGHWYE